MMATTKLGTWIAPAGMPVPVARKLSGMVAAIRPWTKTPEQAEEFARNTSGILYSWNVMEEKTDDDPTPEEIVTECLKDWERKWGLQVPTEKHSEVIENLLKAWES